MLELLQDWGITRTEFETTWIGNTVGTFRVQRSIAQKNNLLTETDQTVIDTTLDKLFNGIAVNGIQALLATGYGKILKKVKFVWLKQKTKDILRFGVYEFIQDSILNQNVWANKNASQIQNNSFSISSDTVSWLIASDVFGMFAKNLFTNAKVNHYDTIDEDEVDIFIKTKNGNFEFIGFFDETKVEELL